MLTSQFSNPEEQIRAILGDAAGEFNVDAIVTATTTRNLDGDLVWTVRSEDEFWEIVSENAL